MINFGDSDISLKDKIEQIPNNLKGQYLDEVIAIYKAKCKQYIEQ